MRRPYGVVIALGLVVGLQTVRSDNYFLGDDFGLVAHLHDLPFARFFTYFAADWTEGIYGTTLDELRPLLAFTYWLDANLYGVTNVAGYHATNVVIHILNGLLVMGIARAVAPKEPSFALLAASLFVMMPTHQEPIAWISGRVDSLASVFYLGAFLCFVRFRLEQRRRWLVAALLAFVSGLFAKQSIVTLPLLLVAFDVVWPLADRQPHLRWSSRVWPHVPFVVVAVVYLAVRHQLFGNAVREDLLTATTIREFIGRQDRYARELMPAPNFAPKPMKVMAEILTVLILAIGAWWMFFQRRSYPHVVRRVLFFGVAWYVITIAPMVVTYLSARHLYITTAGLSLAVASLVFTRSPMEQARRAKARVLMSAVLVVLCAIAAVWNASVWVASGQESGRFAAAFSRLVATFPRGSIVFVSVPEWNRDGWFWSWATPFAFQPPFTRDDLYAHYNIVDPPPVYCCPPDQWWAARKDTLIALMNNTTPQEVTYVEFAPETSDGAKVNTRMVNGSLLKQRIEAAVGRPVESFSTALTANEAKQLSQVLFE